jgi:malic enzyme
MHDDQHGTAIVILAALRNAAAVTCRTLGDELGAGYVVPSPLDRRVATAVAEAVAACAVEQGVTRPG